MSSINPSSVKVQNPFEALPVDDDNEVQEDSNEKASRLGLQNLVANSKAKTNISSAYRPPALRLQANSAKTSLMERAKAIKDSIISNRSHNSKGFAKSNDYDVKEYKYNYQWQKVKKAEWVTDKKSWRAQKEIKNKNTILVEWVFTKIEPDPISGYCKEKFYRQEQEIAERNNALGRKPLVLVEVTNPILLVKCYNLFLLSMLKELTTKFGELAIYHHKIEGCAANGKFEELTTAEWFHSYRTPEKSEKMSDYYNFPEEWFSYSKIADKSKKNYLPKYTEKLTQLSEMGMKFYNEFNSHLMPIKRAFLSIKATTFLTKLIEHIQMLFNDVDHTKANEDELYAFFENITDQLVEAYFCRASIYYQQFNYEKALNDLDCLLLENSFHVEGRLLRGKINFLLCNYDEAAADFECLENNKCLHFIAKGYLTSIQIRVSTGEQLKAYAKSAIDTYITLLRNPELAEDETALINLFYADVLLLIGKEIPAKVYLKRAWNDTSIPFDPFAILLEAKINSAIDTIDPYEAFALLAKCTFNYKEAIYLTAIEMTKLGDDAKALTYLNDLIEESPCMQTLYARATIFQKLGDFPSARKDAEALLKLAPTNSKEREILSNVYFLLALMKDSANIGYNQVRELMKNERHDLALAYLDDITFVILAKCPIDYKEAIFLHVKATIRLGYNDKALIYLNGLINESPCIQTLYARATIYQKLGDLASAAKDAVALLKLAPKNLQERKILRKVYYLHNLPKDTPKTCYDVAMKLAKNGKHELALSYLNDIIKESPSIPTLYARASIYIELKDLASAARDGMELLKFTPSNRFEEEVFTKVRCVPAANAAASSATSDNAKH